MGIFSELTGKRSEAGSIEIRPNETEKMEKALEAITSPIMLVDNDGTISKVNRSTESMMKTAETAIRKELPDFSARNIVGSKVDIFYRHPTSRRGIIESLTDTTRTQFSAGEKSFELITNPILDDCGTQMGAIVEWQDKTEQLLKEKEKFDQNREKKAFDTEYSRIRAALDAVTSNVMMADADNTIVFANNAVTKMLRSAQADIAKELPNFDANNLVGNSIDIFHKNPQHQRVMIESLSNSYQTEIMVGGRTFQLIASPVFDKQGKRLATVVEWQDRTRELEIEESLTSTVDETIVAAINGDFGSRIELTDQKGPVVQICKSINDLLEVLESVTQDISKSVGALASGDLTRKIEKEYPGRYGSLRENVNSTIGKIVDVVSEIRESADSVSTGSAEISDGNLKLSQRTSDQAASLVQTAAAMEEMVTTVQQNTSNAKQANTLARGAREVAENGGVVVTRAVEAMDAISESSNQIADIISVIDEIAFQTNLLALNAAVEAARAGDQGRGFAVVADEVRSLAGRSAKAAKEIKNLIKDSTEKVSEGSKLVNKSGGTLSEIVDAVKKVNDIVEEISTASEEQAGGLDDINTAIGEMDDMTQENACLVEEAAAAGSSLGSQAMGLNKLIEFFKTGNQSRKPATKPAPGVNSPAAAKTVVDKKSAPGSTSPEADVPPEVNASQVGGDRRRSVEEAGKNEATPNSANPETLAGANKGNVEDDQDWAEF